VLEALGLSEQGAGWCPYSSRAGGVGLLAPLLRCVPVDRTEQVCSGVSAMRDP